MDAIDKILTADLKSYVQLYPCWTCQGQGFGEWLRDDHHPNCNGDCVDCPIQIPEQDRCNACGGRGTVIYEQLQSQVLYEVKDNLRAIEILEDYKRNVEAKDTRG